MPTEYKINNNHTPYFARHFMYEYPQYKGFFETRDVENYVLKQKYWDWVRKEGKAIYERFCEKTFALIRAGHKHYSADGILHVIRFEMDTMQVPQLSNH